MRARALTQDGDGKFGFPVNNTIGGTPQPNAWTDSWVDFFREHRLMHQVRTSGNRSLIALAEPVAEKLEVCGAANSAHLRAYVVIVS